MSECNLCDEETADVVCESHLDDLRAENERLKAELAGLNKDYGNLLATSNAFEIDGRKARALLERVEPVLGSSHADHPQVGREHCEACLLIENARDFLRSK